MSRSLHVTPAEPFDLAILGSGFAACVLAMVLGRIGWRCVLIEASAHPRFAIGESSTPMADQILLDLGRDFQLPELTRLGRWASARHLPGVTVGCKRGFSYFFHGEGGRESGAVDPASGRAAGRPDRLLVAASPDQATADSHWLRSSVDHYLARCAVARGVVLWQRTRVVDLQRQDAGWRVRWTSCQASAGAGFPDRTDRSDRSDRSDGSVCGDLWARYVVDATGPARVVSKIMAGKPAVDRWRYSAGGRTGDWTFATRSGSVYGHFHLPLDWASIWRQWQLDESTFPFPPQQAAVHHVTHRGWMWHLGFDSQVVSLGWVLPPEDFAALMSSDSAGQRLIFWQRQLERYPLLRALYGGARLVDPPSGLGWLPRLQRWDPYPAGPGWLALPSTAGFVDPLHSTGIAHSLTAVQRIAWRVQERGGLSDSFLAEYARGLNREFWLLDRLVSAAYLGCGQPQKWEAATMLYFAAAIACEEQRNARLSGRDLPGMKGLRSGLAEDSGRVEGRLGPGHGFLLADWPWFRQRVRRARSLLLKKTPPAAGWLVAMADLLGPLNTVGLCDPGLGGIYRYTVADK